MKRHRAPFPTGFSLIEILVTISMIVLIASISIAVVSKIHSSAKEEKLNSDADTLNRAVAGYLASGGSLDGIKDPGAVLGRLKSAASASLKDRLPGFASSMIDPRISLQMQDASEAGSDDPRAHWDSLKQRFVVSRSGGIGVKEFLLDDSLAEIPAETENRDSAMLYAENSGWVWDYQNRNNPDANMGPTVVSLVPDPVTPPIPATVPPGGPPPLPPPVIPPTGSLDPPVFSIPGGTYGINLYSMSLSMTDPNPAGTSKLIYSVDFGSWQDYNGTVNVPPGSTVSAQAVALSAGWSDSPKIDHVYEASPATLSPPVIDPNRDSFGLFYNYNINVALQNPNDPATSSLRYRLNGGSWTDYSHPFVLDKNLYPSGATIEAQAVSSGSPYYLSSSVSTRSLTNESLNLSGNTSGSFHNPTGGPGMMTNLGPGGSSSYFEWGNGAGSGRSESWTDFAGSSFSDIAEGERFNIGSMTYYNGTIASGSGADTIDLDIGLSLDINGNIFNPFFDFTFDLINTANNGDPWASADYVQLADPRASRTLVINDNEFEFRIEFGETTSNGFSLFDEFHVQENKDASVNLYGTFVSLGPVAGTGSELDGGTTLAATIDASKGGSMAPAAPTDPVYQKEGYVDGEQAATKLSGDLDGLLATATTAADNADGYRKVAEKLSADAIAAEANGDEDDAENLADNSRIAANTSRAQATIAEDAAVNAKIAASEANTIASKDASAQEEAQAAINEALAVIDEYHRANDAANLAETAAANAQAAVRD